jgi:hypothetical protein
VRFSLGIADGVLDAVLALLELHVGGGSGLDHRNTAGQLGQALLQLLAVVVGVAAAANLVCGLTATLMGFPLDRGVVFATHRVGQHSMTYVGGWRYSVSIDPKTARKTRQQRKP